MLSCFSQTTEGALVRQAERAQHQEDISQSSDAHTDSDLAWCRRFLALLAQTTEDVHHQGREADHNQRVHRLEDLSSLNDSEAQVNLDHTQVYIVTSKVSQRVAILVEGHPEEDDHTEDSKESIDALLDFSCTHLYFARRGSTSLSCHFLLAGIRELLLINQEDDSRDTDHHYSSDESIVEATAEYFEILIDKIREAIKGQSIFTDLRHKILKILKSLLRHILTLTQILMAESWELCTIFKVIMS